MIGGAPWTPEEEAVLREAYPSGGIRAASGRLPGRSPSAVAAHANKLGVRGPHSRGRAWSRDERAVMYDAYAELGAEGLRASGRLPGRSVSAIHACAKRLRLRYTPGERPAPAVVGPDEAVARLWTAREDRAVAAIAAVADARGITRGQLSRAARALHVTEWELENRMRGLRDTAQEAI